MTPLLALALFAAAPSPPTPLSEVVTQPPSGAINVPTNAMLVLDDNETVVTATIEGDGTPREVSSRTWRFHDRFELGALQPTTVYTVTIDDDGETDEQVLSLQTGEGPDDTPPATMEGVTFEFVDGEGSDGRRDVVFTLPVPDDDSGIAAFVVLANDVVPDNPPRETPVIVEGVLGATFSYTEGFFFDDPEEQQSTTYAFLAVDWAGNEGTFSDAIEVVVDAPEGAGQGCRCAGGVGEMPPATWALLLVVVPAARRRRDQPKACL